MNYEIKGLKYEKNLLLISFPNHLIFLEDV